MRRNDTRGTFELCKGGIGAGNHHQVALWQPLHSGEPDLGMTGVCKQHCIESLDNPQDSYLSQQLKGMGFSRVREGDDQAGPGWGRGG